MLNQTIKIKPVSVLFAGIFAVRACIDLDGPLSYDPLFVVIYAGHCGEDSGNTSYNVS